MKHVCKHMLAILAAMLGPLVLFFTINDVRGQTCNFNQNYAYKAPNSSAIYYITENCTKRAFTRPDIFFTYFPSWGSVEAAPAKALALIPNDPLGFMPYGPLYDPKYGALVKIVADPKVYLLLGAEKYWITSEEVFLGLGYQWNWVEDVDPRLLDKYKIGSEITDTSRHPNFTLIKYPENPAVYRLEPDTNGNTVKRHIIDEKVFEKLGFRLDRIVTVPAAETYPDGTPLTAADVIVKEQTPTQNPGQNPPGQVVCESDPDPVFTHNIVDPERIVNILPPPNIAKSNGHLKTHSYVDTDVLGIPIYAPVDMEFYNGSHYVGGPYSLDFRVSCEVRIRITHIDPVQAIKDVLPKDPAPMNDSKDQEVTHPVKFKAGDVIAHVYQTEGVFSVGLDFGVYHKDRPNRYADSDDPEIRKSDVYTTAVCPYDFFTPELEAVYRSKMNAVPGRHGGMQKDGPSFCDLDNDID